MAVGSVAGGLGAAVVGPAAPGVKESPVTGRSIPFPAPSTSPLPLRADSTKAAPTRNIPFFISIQSLITLFFAPVFAVACWIVSRKVVLRLFRTGLDDGRMSVSLYQAEYEALRNLMRSVRVKAGLTQVQMAEALGVGQSYVSKLERGENFVDVLLFARWCSACGVKPGKTLDKLIGMQI